MIHVQQVGQPRKVLRFPQPDEEREQPKQAPQPNRPEREQREQLGVRSKRLHRLESIPAAVQSFHRLEYRQRLPRQQVDKQQQREQRARQDWAAEEAEQQEQQPVVRGGRHVWNRRSPAEPSSVAKKN